MPSVQCAVSALRYSVASSELYHSALSARHISTVGACCCPSADAAHNKNRVITRILRRRSGAVAACQPATAMQFFVALAAYIAVSADASSDSASVTPLDRARMQRMTRTSVGRFSCSEVSGQPHGRIVHRLPLRHHELLSCVVDIYRSDRLLRLLAGVSMKTMSRVVILALSSLVAAGAWAQEHAPTLEQCHADRDLWIYQLPKGPNAAYEEVRKSLADITSDALRARQVEMMICMTAIDPMPDDRTDWTSVNGENFSATVLAHQQRLLDKLKWDKYVLLRLAFAEEIEERLMAILKSKK